MKHSKRVKTPPAWAYAGPLDFAVATPIRFAIGADYHQALDDLEILIAEPGILDNL